MGLQPPPVRLVRLIEKALHRSIIDQVDVTSGSIVVVAGMGMLVGRSEDKRGILRGIQREFCRLEVAVLCQNEPTRCTAGIAVLVVEPDA